MDQIKEHITSVLHKQGVLSRLKAELRANVFLAINDQDVKQGGCGLGGKSDSAHRELLAADASGALLVELVREFLLWCNLQFTIQVFEQEMQLGPAASDNSRLQQQLGLTDQDSSAPVLLQLLKQHVASHSLSASAQQQAPAPLAPADKNSAAALTGIRQQQDANLMPGAAAQRVAAVQGAPVGGSSISNASVVAAAGSAAGQGLAAAALPTLASSKTASVVVDNSVDEDAGLINTAIDDEEYAAVFLAHLGAGSELEDDASSTSSTSAKHAVPRPNRSTLDPVGAIGIAAAAAAPDAVGASPGHMFDAGMVGACELSDSFGHNDRSFGDSSLELVGLTHLEAAGAYGLPMAVEVAIASSSSHDSSASSSRSLSRVVSSKPQPQASPAQAPGAQQGSASTSGGQLSTAPDSLANSLPGLRAPGKLAPLPVKSPGLGLGSLSSLNSSSSSGAAKRTSDGLREELIRSGLISSSSPPPASPQSWAQPDVASPEAAASSSSSPRGQAQGSRLSSPAAAVDLITSSRSFGAGAVWQQDMPHAALGAASAGPRLSNSGRDGVGVVGAAHDDADDYDDDSDDFGAVEQRHLLAAARRQLSQRSSHTDLEQQPPPPQQQQQQAVAGERSSGVSSGMRGVMTATFTARLTMSSSDEEDEEDDMIPEDISLPIEALDDGEEYSGVFEAPQKAERSSISSHQNAWVTGAAASPAAAGSAAASRGMQLGPKQLDLELSGETSVSVPLASAAGFVIDDDDF